MKRFLIFFFVIGVIAGGIYAVIGQFSAKPPSPTITVGKQKVEVVQGSYCWGGLFRTVCADTSAPPDLIKHQGLKPIAVSPESSLKIAFKNEPTKNTLEANRWLNNGETEAVTINKNVLTAPKEKGVYVYEIFARWKNGDSSYAFVIEVREDSKH